MLPHAIDTMVRADYGVTLNPAGMRRLARAVQPKREIKTAGQYVAACRSIGWFLEFQLPWLGMGDWLPLSGECRVDGRLVAAGFNHESPTRWVRGDGERPSGLVTFAMYWHRAVERPETIGSSCNGADVHTAYRAMRIGIPPHVLLRLGERAVIGRDDPAAAERLRRLPRRRINRLRHAARAAARTSLRDDEQCLLSTKALAALGRLCPELQRVAVEALRSPLGGETAPTRKLDHRLDPLSNTFARDDTHSPWRRRMNRPMSRDELREKLRRMLSAQTPGPPTMRCSLTPNDPHYYDPDLDETGALALLEEATPAGWEWRGADRSLTPNGRGWTYRVHLERSPIAAPFTPARVLDEYEMLDGDWQAVSIMLGVSYAEFVQWMNTDDFADLAGIWGEERVRYEALKRSGEKRKILRGPYTRRAQDDAELVKLSREHLFAAPLAQQMRDQVTDGRTWPPVAVLRRYCETGHQGLLEHLRELDWVD